MWRYLWLIPLYLVVASLPFVTEFGRNLEYEYTLALSYLVLVIIPVTAILTPRRLIQTQNGRYTPYIAFDVIWIAFIGPFILALPALFVYLTGTCPCSESGFGFWYVIQVYPAWVLANALYHGIFRLRVMGYSQKKLFWSGVAIYVALIVSLILSFLFAPQVRRLDLLAGFIHGPIYDNWIPVDSGIAFGRLAHLFLACALLSFAWINKKDWASIGVTVALSFCWVLTSIMASTFPSVAVGASKLDQLLPDELKNDFFTMHYLPDEAGKNPNRKIRRLYHEAIFHVAELREMFGKESPHVQIYVYPDDDTKKVWFGGGATDVTDVFTPSVHITAGRSPHQSLRHELVHAISSEFSYMGLGFHPNMAFTEGLAVALAPEERDISLHDGAAALIVSKRLPKLSSLFSPFFWKESGSRAYTVAGSIISYLITTHGFDSVKRLYSGESWQSVFKEERITTLNKWRDFVMKNYDEKAHELYAESLFRYPGVFHAVCPHSKADLRRRRDRSPYIRLRQPVGWDPDKDYWAWRTTIDPEDRYALVSQWTTEINRFAKGKVITDGRLNTWREAVRNARFWPPKTLEDVELALLESDLLRLLRGREESLKLLNNIDAYARTSGIGSSLVRQLRARIMVETDLTEAQAIPWRRYLAGWRENIPDLTADEPWILTYLRLRSGEAKMLDQEFLVKAMDLPLDPKLQTTFVEEWYKFLAYRLMQLQAFQSAGQVYQRGYNASTPAEKEYFSLLQREAKFYAEKL